MKMKSKFLAGSHKISYNDKNEFQKNRFEGLAGEEYHTPQR